jgi:hypothetical protein
LAIPHKEVGPARREINRLSRDWPRNGELKGGMLKRTHLKSLVEVLFRHDALMHACAMRMSSQLYIQCVMMKELVRIASEQVTLYFAQRRPRELAKSEWTIDAKDPRRITSQEKWWRDMFRPIRIWGIP